MLYEAISLIIFYWQLDVDIRNWILFASEIKKSTFLIVFYLINRDKRDECASGTLAPTVQWLVNNFDVIHVIQSYVLDCFDWQLDVDIRNWILFASEIEVFSFLIVFLFNQGTNETNLLQVAWPLRVWRPPNGTLILDLSKLLSPSFIISFRYRLVCFMWTEVGTRWDIPELRKIK